MNSTRRAILAAGLAAPLPACVHGASMNEIFDVIVVGAGVFGAWTAEHLRRRGRRVLLVDQMGPGNARSSSGGESRLTRAAYGADRIYSEMALAALPEWKALSAAASLPIFHETGVLFCFNEMVDYARQSIEAHRALGVPLEELDRAALAGRWPQMNLDGVAFALFEPDFGALMARRGVEETVRRFTARGGAFRIAHARPGADGREVVLNGAPTRADAIVYACGPWLPKVFPALLAERIFVTRQEIAFVAPPDGDDRFEAHALPGWIDYNGGDVYYGFPNLEARGFKLARDTHGASFDPDSGDRRMSDEGAALLRAYLARRFPALADRPFTEFRVCQYENSSSGDFLIDGCPGREGAFLLGGGSGHGFKHGPEVGRLMADLVLDGRVPDQRFSYAAKGVTHRREVL